MSGILSKEDSFCATMTISKQLSGMYYLKHTKQQQTNLKTKNKEKNKQTLSRSIKFFLNGTIKISYLL